MNKWAGLVVLIFVSFVSCKGKAEKPAQIILNEKKYAEFCSNADNYLKEMDFKGSVLVAKGKKIVFAKGYGFCDLMKADSAENDIWTTFEAGSLTKQMVACGILQLEKKGLLSQKDSVGKYFPELRTKSFDQVTIRMLLNMRSGFCDHINSGRSFFPRKIYNQLEKNQLNNEKVDEKLILKYLPGTDFEAKPDSTYVYSNTNYYLLAKIIEMVSGVNYLEYMQKNILDKADMNCSNFEFQKTAAKGYAGGRYYSIPAAFAVGCGDLNTCVFDLFKWNCAFTNGKITGKSFVRKLKNSRGYNYGFYCGKKRIFHAGITNVFNSYNSYDFDNKVSVIVLCNTPVNVCNATKVAGYLQNSF